MRALEDEAGVQLFDRARGAGHGSQISLTEAGRVLLGYANAAAETMVEARRALARLNHEAAGPLKLGASSTVAQYLLPRILGEFLKTASAGKAFAGEWKYRADCGGRWRRRRSYWGLLKDQRCGEMLKTERMVEDEMVLIASPNHAWVLRKGGAIEGGGVDEGAAAVEGARVSDRGGWWSGP